MNNEKYILERSGNGQRRNDLLCPWVIPQMTKVTILYLTKTNTLTFQYLDYSLYCEPQLPPVFSKCTTTEKTQYCAWGLGKLSVYPTGTVRYSQCFVFESQSVKWHFTQWNQMILFLRKKMSAFNQSQELPFRY